MILDTHYKNVWLGAKFETKEFQWGNGNAYGLHNSSDWWCKERGEPDGGGICIGSFPIGNQFLLRDQHCNNYLAGFLCEKDMDHMT